jgi:hypothetical protein
VAKRSARGGGVAALTGDNPLRPADKLLGVGQQRLLLDALSAQRSYFKLAEAAPPASGLALKAGVLAAPGSSYKATLAAAIERMQPTGLSALASAHGSAYQQTLAAVASRRSRAMPLVS